MSQNLKENTSLSNAPAAGPETHSSIIKNLTEFDERIRRALSSAAEKKAQDLTILDLRGIAGFTDFFLIASGTNRRQVQAISDEVLEQLKRHGTRAARVEGYQTAEWILLDFGDFIVHVFDEKARRFFDLERLWREAVRIDVPPEVMAAQVL